jgi:hypothetical protein
MSAPGSRSFIVSFHYKLIAKNSKLPVTARITSDLLKRKLDASRSTFLIFLLSTSEFVQLLDMRLWISCPRRKDLRMHVELARFEFVLVKAAPVI